MDTIEIKAFVPARDYDLSRRFYGDLGFTEAWASDTMAYLSAGNCSFLLQKFYVREHAENFMMHMLVADVDAWWQNVIAQDLAARYGLRVQPPQDQPWGIRDFCIVDPTGVLWRIGQSLEDSSSGLGGTLNPA
nr:VOC family protein [Variovorax paradoxus]